MCVHGHTSSSISVSVIRERYSCLVCAFRDPFLPFALCGLHNRQPDLRFFGLRLLWCTMHLLKVLVDDLKNIPTFVACGNSLIMRSQMFCPLRWRAVRILTLVTH